MIEDDDGNYYMTIQKRLLHNQGVDRTQVTVVA